MQVVQLERCEAFVTKDGSIIRELLAHRNSAIRNQSLAEATIQPGCQTQAHYHQQTEEIYFILSGSGMMTIGEQTQRVSSGDAIAIPPGAVHYIYNDGDQDVRLLCCCAPGYEHADTYLV